MCVVVVYSRDRPVAAAGPEAVAGLQSHVDRVRLDAGVGAERGGDVVAAVVHVAAAVLDLTGTVAVPTDGMRAADRGLDRGDAITEARDWRRGGPACDGCMETILENGPIRCELHSHGCSGRGGPRRGGASVETGDPSGGGCCAVVDIDEVEVGLGLEGCEADGRDAGRAAATVVVVVGGGIKNGSD